MTLVELEAESLRDLLVDKLWALLGRSELRDLVDVEAIVATIKVGHSYPPRDDFVRWVEGDVASAQQIEAGRRRARARYRERAPEFFSASVPGRVHRDPPDPDEVYELDGVPGREGAVDNDMTRVTEG